MKPGTLTLGTPGLALVTIIAAVALVLIVAFDFSWIGALLVLLAVLAAVRASWAYLATRREGEITRRRTLTVRRAVLRLPWGNRVLRAA